jgi:hypothetical protein
MQRLPGNGVGTASRQASAPRLGKHRAASWQASAQRRDWRSLARLRERVGARAPCETKKNRLEPSRF